MTNEQIQATLSQLEPFAALPNDRLVELAGYASLRKAAAKEFIFTEGEEATAGYAVVSGRVALLKCSPSGKELILDLLPAGEVFGVVALVDTKPYPLSARAQAASVVLELPRRTVAPFLERNVDVRKAVYDVITTRFRTSQNVARALAHDRVETRIASVLLASIPRLAMASPTDQIVLELGRQELADVVGTTLETASRVVKALEKSGAVDASKQGVLTILSMDALRVVATTL